MVFAACVAGVVGFSWVPMRVIPRLSGDPLPPAARLCVIRGVGILIAAQPCGDGHKRLDKRLFSGRSYGRKMTPERYCEGVRGLPGHGLRDQCIPVAVAAVWQAPLKLQNGPGCDGIESSGPDGRGGVAGAVKVGGSQVGAREVGVGQIGVSQAGAVEVRAREVRAGKVRSCKVEPAKVLAGEVSSRVVDSRSPHALVERVEPGGPDGRGIKYRAGKVGVGQRRIC